MDKIKLLFVVQGFARAGAERYMYEIDSALDKKKYDVTILCLEIKSKFKQYYKDEHLKLGTKVVSMHSFLVTYTIFRRIKSKISKFLFNKKYVSNVDTKIFNNFLINYDLINWMGEYTYFHYLNDINNNKSLIFIMSGKFQNQQLYKDFDFDRHYNIVSCFNDNECSSEYSEFKSYTHSQIPLLLKIPFTEKKWVYKDSDTKKVAIFTRLSKYKPLDPFFYSFQLLLDKIPNCELHVFGNGDPEVEGMNRYLKNLGIEKKVFFRGHQENMIETIVNEHVDLSWFQGYNNDRPAGFAGLDVCTTGTPLLCWDFMDYPINSFNEVYPHYKSLTQFVNKSYEILTNGASAENLSLLQFNDVCLSRDIEKHIHLLENVFTHVLSLPK
jgi:glycosyltransferase involved in cell wall biosynthesis